MLDLLDRALHDDPDLDALRGLAQDSGSSAATRSSRKSADSPCADVTPPAI